MGISGVNQEKRTYDLSNKASSTTGHGCLDIIIKRLSNHKNKTLQNFIIKSAKTALDNVKRVKLSLKKVSIGKYGHIYNTVWYAVNTLYLEMQLICFLFLFCGIVS